MEISNFLSNIGLGNVDIGYILLVLAILVLILITLNIVSLVKIANIRKRLRKFMKGKDARSLEKDIIGLYEDNKFLKNMTEINKKDIRNLTKRFAKAFQRIGLEKYYAYQQMC